MTLIPLHWQQQARQRRWIMFGLISIITALASYWLLGNLPSHLPILLKTAILIPFVILLFWLELGFFTALLGFWMLAKHKKIPHSAATITPSTTGMTNYPPPDQTQSDDQTNHLANDHPTKPPATTAILLPIYNEDVAYVYAGLKSIYQSLQTHHCEQQFEFYILSDSDKASYLLKEGAAWTTLCEELNAKGRIHYRHRKHRVKKKSGNIMDFCRRWGNLHPYMIVLDADSLMGAKTLTTLVSMMDENPNVGLIQAPLYSTGMDSLFARSQQFVNRLYGPVFFAGLYYWWQGESQYWGHNVIIRTQAFMQHCDLPKLTESGALGGEILSHDFVEAALLNRAGWETWLAFDLDDSFERPPPTLTDALKRDRRWCQGNLQHWHIIWAKHIPHLQRFLLLGGIMSYVSSLIWLVWLVALSIAAIFYTDLTLIPNNPQTQTIFVFTLILLFVYKMFGLAYVIQSRQIHLFGGSWQLCKNIFLETVLSVLVAPIRMFYYSRFVLEILTGQRISWTTQQRTGHQLNWRDTLWEYRWISLFGLTWAALLLSANVMSFYWMLPVLAGLILAAPVAVMTSYSVSNKKWFITPDDTKPTDVLRTFEDNYQHLQQYTCLSSQDIFTHVLVNPIAHKKFMAYIPYRSRIPEKTKEQREQLANRLLSDGPKSLNNQEYLTLLGDPVLLSYLHERIWKLPEDVFQKYWLADS